MMSHRFIKTFIISLALIITLGASPAFCQSHIKDLDSLRNSMVNLGNEMPAMIKNTKNNEMRTLERVYEINTYALTTIEAYFKMVKVAVVAEGKINKAEVEIFNGWLQFIAKYCEKDNVYLDEAISEMKNPAILDVLERSKEHIKSLKEIAIRAVGENNDLLKKR